MNTVLVSHGEPEGAALWRWLKESGVAISLVELPADLPVERYSEQRRGAQKPQRIALLTGPGSDLPAFSDAAAVLRRWFSGMPPIDLRAHAAELVERRVREGAEGSVVLETLRRRMLPPALRGRPRGKRGRPPGTNPFIGVGFDVCVELLLDPDSRWSERRLAAQIGHVPSAVHRILVELEQRGHVRRERAAIRLLSVDPLRDELAVAWRNRIAARPAAARLIAPPVPDVTGEIVRNLTAHGLRCILAGANAVRGPERLIGGPLTLYAEEGAVEILLKHGFEPASIRGDTEIWPPIEEGVFRHPRRLGGHEATNRVVTYLDLAQGTDRSSAAAEAVWKERP